MCLPPPPPPVFPPVFSLAVLLSLSFLIAYSKAIAASGVEDVRDVLDFYRNEEDVVGAFKRNQELLRKQQEEQLSQLQQKAGARWSFFGRVRI